MPVEAAVGLAQLQKYPQIVQSRRDNALFYHQHLERREGWHFPPLVTGATYSHYVVRVPNRKSVVDEWAKHGNHLGELIQYSISDLSIYKKPGIAVNLNAREASKGTVNFSVSIKTQ